MTTYLSLAIGACFLIAFLVMCNKKRSVLGVYIKNLTSIFFLLTTVTSAFNNTGYADIWKYALLIVMGGVFGLMGDIYLDQKWLYTEHKDQYLNMGFISFGIGHFFYMAAMYIHAGFVAKDMLIPVAIGAVIALGNLVLEKPTQQKFGKFKAIVTVYGLILGTMAGTALMAYIKTKQPAFLVYTIGAVFFLLSDLILSPMYFGEGKNTPVNFVLNHTTYYVGQYMIAFSTFLLAANA